ncbi:UDP-hexose transferase [Devosia psychrophila]|uniref:UDP-hexose transferase n=1 Tax=Devosia psychrophila TaxID=728005 RepID=A0ABR5DUP2_9HYPH|nr:UDP-hexose transferase [Devosia psychrophila]
MLDRAPVLAATPTIMLGGLPIAVVTRAQAARQMLDASRSGLRGVRPIYLTSSNGEVIAWAASDKAFAQLLVAADQIVADGQPMVVASRFLCRLPLPERIATTDVFHDVARLAVKSGHSFYFLGATQKENFEAVERVRKAYPELNIAGYSHGFLAGAELDQTLADINALAPDILWLALGVPREQEFIAAHGDKLRQVGVIKTSGGLFNFLSGTNRRAPEWMQRAGLEWAFRIFLEPKRLFWRYLTTNPVSAYLILTRSK